MESRRWFLGTVAGGAASAVLRHPRQRRRNAYAAAAAGEGDAVPVSILNTGTFNPVPAGFPDSTNTGFQNAPGTPANITGAGLTDGSNITIQSNTTYSFYKNLGQFTTFFYGAIGTPAAPVHNVTFTGCLWENTTANGPCAALCTDGPVTFQYCTFRPLNMTAPPVTYAQGYKYGLVTDGSPASPGTWNTFSTGPVMVDHCDFWGFSAGIYSTGGTQAAPRTYQYNYIHDGRIEPAGQDIDHMDGLGHSAGGVESYTQVLNNSIIGYGNPQQDDTQALCYLNIPGPANWDHFTVSGNLFTGYGFTVNVINGTQAAPAPPTNLTFTGNTFTTQYKPIFGPLYTNLMGNIAAGNVWRGNKWKVPPGAAWGNPAHDGWYWMPVDNVIQGTDDTQYVSLTDYM